MDKRKVLKYVNANDKNDLRRISQEINMDTKEGRAEARAIGIALLEEVERQNGAAGFSAPQLGNFKRVIAIKTFELSSPQIIAGILSILVYFFFILSPLSYQRL